jgi:hypothetical protein
MDQWERNFYITSLAGANNGSSLVVMSRGISLIPALNNKTCTLACQVPGFLSFYVLALWFCGFSVILELFLYCMALSIF